MALNICSKLIFFSKSKTMKNEFEEAGVKNDIVVDISTSKETPNVKRKSTLKNNNSKKNSSLKKKKLSQNWNISDDI